MLPAAAPPRAASTCAVSADDAHPAAAALPWEAAGDEAGEAAAVPGAAGPLDVEPPPEAELTGPQAVSAAVHSTVAAPSR